MKLVIADDDTPKVAFRLESDGADIDVYANDVFIGWFDTEAAGLVQFRAAYISEDDRSLFAISDTQSLLTVA